jgi:hypothetical protein
MMHDDHQSCSATKLQGVSLDGQHMGLPDQRGLEGLQGADEDGLGRYQVRGRVRHWAGQEEIGVI